MTRRFHFFRMSVIPTAEETGWSVRNRCRIFGVAMVAERQSLEHRPAGRGHPDSLRHRADLSAVAFRPGLRGLRRLVHHSLDPLRLTSRSRGTGSIQCDRGDGVPGGCGSDDVLAEVKEWGAQAHLVPGPSWPPLIQMFSKNYDWIIYG